MLTRNLTPHQVGTKLTARRPPQAEMMIVVRATYAIAPDGALTVVGDPIAQRFLSAEAYAPDDDELSGPCLYPSDFADFKLNAEALLVGSCHVGGKPLTECLVRFAVGGWSKTLRVVGRRAWSDQLPGAVASAPIPFTKMPLGWENAFGGPGFAKNPAGAGLGATLPTVEYPEEPVKSRGQRPEPATFGPVNPAWPPRAGKQGREYGRAWRQRRAPFYAEDFDWTHFHAAPADQQLPGYLHGDEELLFQNLHPTAPTLRARLPGLRVRVFVHDDEGRFHEAAMVLDTLLADLDEGRIEVTFRGHVPVREHDLEDVRTVLVAEEKIGERLPVERYHEQILAFEVDPVGFAAALPEGFADVIERAEAERKGTLPALRPDLDPISARLEQRLGRFAADEQRRVAEGIAEVQAKAGPHRDVGADLARVAEAIDDAPPAIRVNKPGAMPPVGLRRPMRALLEGASEARKGAAKEGVPAEAREKLLARAAELEAVPRDPRWTQLDPRYRPPEGPISTEEPGPGRDLSEQDLTGRVLRGMDLRGANLEGAILTRADLSGADLSGAVLRDAVLFKANLTGARLLRADLSRANLARAVAREADLGGADLRLAFFEDADLRGASLADVEAEYAIFTRADLRAAKALRAHLDHADFEGADLSGATLDEASLAWAKLPGATGRRASLVAARLGGASFNDADFAGASFADARGERAVFEGACLEGADLSHADLPSSHFTKARAAGASLRRANLPASRFYRARLDEVDATEANFFQADLSRARLTRTRFVKANLYEASFVGAAGEGTILLEANLKKSTLERDR